LCASFVLAVTALKDATEDYARHKQDRLKNLSAYQVYRQGEWRSTQNNAAHAANGEANCCAAASVSQCTDRSIVRAAPLLFSLFDRRILSKNLLVGDIVKIKDGQRSDAPHDQSTARL